MFVDHYNAMGIIPTGLLERLMEQSGQSALWVILNRSAHALLFYNAVPDTTVFYAPGTPLLDPFSGILFAFGIGYSIYRIKDQRYFLFLAWLVLALFLGAVMIIDENGSERLVTTAVPVIFLVALGLDKLIDITVRIFTLLTESGRKSPVADGDEIAALRKGAPHKRAGLAQSSFVALGVLALGVVGYSFYFLDYTPARPYGYEGLEMLTEVPRFLLRQPQPFKVYFFGAPYNYITHGTIRYMDPDLNGMDVNQPLTNAPDFVDASLPAIFVFGPGRFDDFKFVQQAYPDGSRFDYKTRDGKELFFAYTVEHP